MTPDAFSACDLTITAQIQSETLKEMPRNGQKRFRHIHARIHTLQELKDAEIRSEKFKGTLRQTPRDIQRRGETLTEASRNA